MDVYNNMFVLKEKNNYINLFLINIKLNKLNYINK